MHLLKKNGIILTVIGFIILGSAFSTDNWPHSKKIKLNISPATAKVHEGGPQGPVIGTGSMEYLAKRNYPNTIYITENGYVSQSRTFPFTSRAEHDAIPKGVDFNLKADPTFDATSVSVDVNRNVALRVKKDRSMEEAWEILQTTILAYFDILEANDGNTGYLRTSWVGTNFTTNTIRERLIIKKAGNNPIQFNLKFISEESGVNGTSYSDDSKFKPFDRIPKKYDALIGELMTKLAN